MLHFCSRLNYFFSTTQRYTIKKLNYLIEAPPVRPNNSYAVFLKQQLTGKGMSGSDGLKKASEKWKTLSAAQKQKYGKGYEQKSANYQKEKAEYASKFVTPFKHISGLNLFMSHLYKDKVVTFDKKGPISQNSKTIGQKIKNRSKQDLAKYAKEAEKVKAERSQEIQNFKFPTRLYHSQVGYSRANPHLDKKLRARAYRIYVSRWEKEVEKWLKNKNYNISISDFKRLYKKELKRLRIKREDTEADK